MKYRKKPIIVEAMQFDGSNGKEIIKWVGDPELSSELINVYRTPPGEYINQVLIKTPEGTMYANPGDWIVRGVEGEYYPCKPGIFEKTYEHIDETTW